MPFARRQFVSLILLPLCLCASVVGFSCTTKPTDMRLLVPAETLIYLETNDLAAALQPIVDSKPFREAATSTTDISVLRGVQLAVAVTGFETTEQKLTDENSVGRIQPRFVAIADTHAWNYQAVAFADQKLGQFVTDIYGADVTQDQIDKNGGKYFTWTSNDGRKSHAQVIDSLIYFGNDESIIDKCMAVRRGEADSIAKTGKVAATDPNSLASGYVSTDGVAQLGNIAGLRFGSDLSDESEVQSAIAGLLPRLIRSSVTEIRWVARKTDDGIEDRYQVSMPADVANIFVETMAAETPNMSMLDRLTCSPTSVTLYNLSKPQVAWRSLFLVAQKQTDPVTAQLIGALSNGLLAEYGIADAEAFLKSAGPTIVSSTIAGNSGDEHVVAAAASDIEAVKKALDPTLKKIELAHENGRVEVWRSEDESIAATFAANSVVFGETDAVLKCIAGRPPRPLSALFAGMARGGPPAATITYGTESAMTLQLLAILGREGHGELPPPVSQYLTETRFTKTGMERRTVSDLGLIGSIIGQLSAH